MESSLSSSSSSSSSAPTPLDIDNEKLKAENALLRVQVAALREAIRKPDNGKSLDWQRVREMTLWDDLTTTMYHGGCPVSHVTAFNDLVRQNHEAGNAMSEPQKQWMFLRSATIRAGEWVIRQRALLQVTHSSLQNIQEDFVSEFRNKTTKATEKSDSQAHHGKNSKNKCWNCGKKGHIRRNCPGKDKDPNDENNGDSGKPLQKSDDNVSCSCPAGRGLHVSSAWIRH
ncbi:hypothetical protein F5X96DRAFT_624337 [Biscogniauxia mediterranea]|nr:hypothetical protein F5X96DRAFT_624337 [Biscogniauxia mediterranea]